MLNPQQIRFCDEYFATGVAKSAYQKVFGVSDAAARANSSRLLKNPEVQARLQELARIASDAKVCSDAEIRERLSQVARRELSEVCILPNGHQITKPTPIKDSVRALELLAKISGMFVQKAEVDFNANLPIIIKDDL